MSGEDVSRTGKGIILLAWVLASATMPVAADTRYVGEARDPDSGALLYEEHHLLREVEARPRERLVLYRCLDGRLFARKLVTYGDAGAAPAFALEDGRFGYREGARREDGAIAAFVRADGASAERSAGIAASPRLVIDAGFDQFVRTQWEALQRGDTLAVDFVVPSRLKALRFKLRRTDSVVIAGAPASVFRLSLGGLIGYFAPDIEVSYRDIDRRLMRFEGLTNIRADRDDNLVARIDFPPERQRDRMETVEWNAAAAEVLTDCKPGG